MHGVDMFLVIYPFRFFAMAAHFVVTGMFYRGVPMIVASGLPSVTVSNEGRQQREQLLITFISLTLGFMGIEAAFLSFGLSLGMPRLSLFSGCAHAFGAFFSLWALLDGWAWQSVPWLFALFTFPPFVAEMCVARPVGPAKRFLSSCGTCLCEGAKRGAAKAAAGTVACAIWAGPKIRECFTSLAGCCCGVTRGVMRPGYSPPNRRRGSDAGTELT